MTPQYAVSIKEDTAYPFLHFTRNHEEFTINTPYPEDLNTPIKDFILALSDRHPTYHETPSDQAYPNDCLSSVSEENSKEEVEETMAETMEQYMSKTRADYESGVVRPKIDDKDHFELKGQFLKELQDNTFSGLDHKDANEHIEKVLEIVDLFHVPNITQDQVMLRVFSISLTGAASHWLRNKPSSSIKT
ncbi:hypothetical protein Tco_0863508 [Tanacetum coccineum]